MQSRVIILNYNGRELLPKCLPSIAEAAKEAAQPARITVLDNRSPDDDLAYVRSNFPGVEVVIAPENRYLCSYNDYLRSIQEPVVILLNNDIRVERGFIDPLLEKFTADPETFLVAPRVMSFDGKRVEAGRSKAGIRWGFFWCDARYPGYEKTVDLPSMTFSSGFGAFSREKFLALGGYDPLYLPGIMEDVDLCYRAEKKGHHLFYEPRSIVYHIGQASFKKEFGGYETSVLAHRNNFLFMWKNFGGFGFLIQHWCFLPLRLLYALLRGKPAMPHGFLKAVLCKIGKPKTR